MNKEILLGLVDEYNRNVHNLRSTDKAGDILWNKYEMITKGHQLKVDYENQVCVHCKGPLERPKRTNKPACERCQKAREAKKRKERNKK